MGTGGRWGLDVKFPQFCCWHAGALKDDSIVVPNGDCRCCERHIAPGITQLPNGYERLCCESGNDVAMAGRWWETRYIKVSFVGRMEYDT